MSRLEEQAAFAPEPSWAYSALNKPIPENIDVLNRTVSRVPPTGSPTGTVLAPLNASGSPLNFNFQCAGNSKILLHQTALEINLVFHNGAGATLVQSVPIFDIWGALVETMSLSINGTSSPIFTTTQRAFLEQHLAYLITNYSRQQLEELPWLMTPCFADVYASNNPAGGPELNTIPTYLARAQRWFYADGAGVMTNSQLRVIRLVIPLRDALGIRLPDSSPNNLRSMILSINWNPDRTVLPFVRFTATGPPLIPPACSVSVLSANLLVASSVMSGAETASSARDRASGEMDILGFITPQFMRLQPSTDMIFGAVANMQMCMILQSTRGVKGDGAAAPGTITYSDATQFLPINAYRTGAGALFAAADLGDVPNLPSGCSISYGSIAMYPSTPMILNDANRISMDEAKYYYDLAIDRVSRRDLVPCVNKALMAKTQPFILLKPFSAENITLTRIAKDLIIRFSSISGAPAPAVAGADDGLVSIIAFRCVAFGLTPDGQVITLQ